MYTGQIHLTLWAESIMTKRDKCREVSVEFIQVGER